MSIYSQPELLRRSTIFTTHGLTAEAQAIIAHVGFCPDEIRCGNAKLATVRTAEAHKVNMDAQKRKAIQTAKIAREAAQKELTSLSKTLRALFADHEPIMGLLELKTPYETLTTPENGAAKNPPDQPAPTETLTHWRLLLAGAEKLAPAEQEQLALAGWPPSRLATTNILVEGCTKADIAQRTASATALAANVMHKAALKDLETWYLKARRLTRTALKTADPANSQNLNELLGFD